MRMVKYWCSECRLIFEVEEKYDVPGLKCPDCGHPMFHGRGDIRFDGDGTVFMPPPKNRILYALLAFFFGLIGLHNLYAGFLIRGAIQFILTAVFSWTFTVPVLVSAWALAEVFFQRKDSTGQKMEGSAVFSTMIALIMMTSITLLSMRQLYPHPFFMLSKPFLTRDIDPGIAKGHLKNLSLAVKLYAIDNHDFFPNGDNAKGLHQLKSGGYLRGVEYYRFPPGTNSRNVRIPNIIKESDSRLIYLGGLAETVAPDTLLAFEKPEQGDESVNVLFVNGSLGKVKLSENAMTCEDVLRSVYDNDFTSTLRAKQLDKVKMMDKLFASGAYVSQPLQESPAEVQKAAAPTPTAETDTEKTQAAPSHMSGYRDNKASEEKREESPIKCFKEDDWSSIVK